MSSRASTPVANAEMSDFWNQEGGRRWIRFQKNMDVGLLPFGHAAMEIANITAGEQVLDVGCGCGDTSLEIARQVGPDGRVEGLDVSQLILARAKARVVDGQNVSFRNADAQTHAFLHASFDLIFSRFGVMFFDDPIAAFSNLRSALRPGGRVVFVCWRPAKYNGWVRLPFATVATHLPVPPAADPDEPGPFAFGDAARVLHILAEAGYSDATVQPVDVPFTIGDTVEEGVELLMNVGPTSGLISASEAGPDTLSHITADLHQLLTHHDSRQGLSLGGAVWVVSAWNR